jgi:hypothetical protein
MLIEMVPYKKYFIVLFSPLDKLPGFGRENKRLTEHKRSSITVDE